MRVSVRGSKIEMAEMLEVLAEGLRYDEKLPKTGGIGVSWEIKEEGEPFNHLAVYSPTSGNTSEEA